MALFGRKATAPKDSRVPVERSPEEWAREAIETGSLLRIAIESGDFGAAGRAAKEHGYADARRKGYPGDDGFILFDVEGVRLARTFQEPMTLGLSAERVAEVRTALALVDVIGDTENRGVLAAFLGTPIPTWEAFSRERQEWQSTGSHPEMWQDDLVDEEPQLPSQTRALSALSSDARQVLTYANVMHRRIAVARALVAQRTWLPQERLENAMADLTAAGFAGTPTVQDTLMTLTVDQLKAALAALGLVGKGVKPKLVEALAAADPDQLRSYLLANHPEALAMDWWVGIESDGSELWLTDFAYLAGHWLSSSLATARLIATRGTKSPHIFRTDKCAVCQHPTKSLPPFHIGCRCSWS
jgi:hypothetical protein